jgi:hypothetical protein
VARVVFFTTGPACTLCERTRRDLEGLAARFGFPWRTVALHELDAPISDYLIRAPVVHIDGELALEGRIDRASLERALRAAHGLVPEVESEGSGGAHS